METKENQNPTVIASEQSERGNLHTTENGRLNQEIATTATQSRNDENVSGSLNVSPEQEFSATAERLGGEDAYKQAKESGKTALTYKQWVQVRTPSFKAWFGDWENNPKNASKVLNPDTGEPRVMYRGSPEQLGYIFEHGKNFYGGNRGFWFSPHRTVAERYAFDEVNGRYGEIKEVFLNIRNPLDLTPLKKTTTSKDFYDYIRNQFDIDLERGSNKEFFTETLYAKHQDILYANSDFDGNILIDEAFWSFIAKNHEQIKSATDNIGTFDRENSDIRYNLNTQENSEFARAVDDIVNGVEPTGRFIRLGTTPDVWQLIGIPDVKVSIQDDRIQKVMGEYLNLQPHEHSHSHIHNLTPEMMKQLPQQLNEPIAILQSAPTSSNPDGFLVLTELLETDKKTGEEKPVVAALNLVRNRKDNEIRIVNVTTAFGRDNWQTERDINNGLLRYWDKDKGQKFLNTTSLQLLADVTSSSALIANNIKTNEDLMQYRKEKEMSNQSETPTVIASEQSERGNLHTTKNGRLNQEIATPATQVRNDGLNSGSLNNEQPTADKGGFSLDSEYSPNTDSVHQSALNEFFTERDARAFSARWKMQQLLPEILGQAAYQHLSVETLHQIYHEQPDALDHLNENALPQGFYVSDKNKVVIIADAFIGREDTAAFTAWHELGHRGINIQGRELWNDWLKEARSNDTVRQIANHTQDLYARQGIELSDLQATEEAMVDIFAAYKTQQWDRLEHRHQLKIHDEFKKPLGTTARLWNAAKEKIGKIFNRQPEKVSDEQIFAMLGKLEQSIYQQPELAVQKRLEMGEAFTNYYDLNNQWKQLDLFETLTTADLANGIDDNNLSGSLTTTRGADTVIASENPTVIASINEVNAWQSPNLESETKLNDNLIAKIKAAYPDETNRSIRQKLDSLTDDNYNFLENGFEKTKELFPKAFSGNLNDKNTVKSEPQSERGNPLNTENSTLNQEIATPATQVRNDENISGNLKEPTAPREVVAPREVAGSLNIENSKTTPLSKEQKAQLKAAKDAVSTLKKELNSLRSEYDRKMGYSYFNETESRYRIIHAQRNLHEAERTYNRLYLDLHSQTGEMTDIEKQIFNARLSGKLSERVAIVLPELKAQKDELRQEYVALSGRIRRLDFDEFEIQGAMQDAIEHFNKHHYRILRHNGKDLPHSTDREKAIAYLAKVVMPEQLNQIATPHNRLVRKISQLSRRETYTPDEMADRYQVRFLSVLETAENQLIKGSIEARTEINLTYDINTPDGEQKVRELFYKNPHDSEQAELFEKVFAMAQKLNVEVRHALTDKYVNIDTRNYLGVYLYTQNSARVKHNGRIKPEQKGEVLLHELVHAVSSRAMVLKEQGHTELLNPAQIQAIDEIEKIFKSVWNKAEALGLEKYSHQKGDYGLKNAHEMLAELANPEFRDKLKQIGVFDDTVAKITEISTGVGQAETVYDRLQKALYQLMDNYDPDFGEKYDKAKIRNIQMFDIKEENHMQEELLNQLDSQDASIRRDAASSEYADEAVLRKAFNDKHWQVREDAMRNTRATPELLHEWYQDADPYDKAIILDNPRIGNKTLIDALSDDNDLRYQALYRADKDANREVLHIAEQNSNPEIAQLASQYVSFYEPKIGNKKDPTWLDANLIREDWEHTLNSFNSMQALNETLTVESNLNQEDLVQLANLHQTKPELREKIENLLNESQLHQAINDLKQGQYDQFRLPETAFGVSQKDTVIASEQSERGNLLNTENDPLVLDNGKFTQYAFETKVQDILRKDFAEIIELSKQPKNPELVQKQEEVFNLLQSIHHFEKQDLRAMTAVKETNNPLITQLVERAISEPYPHNDWNRQEILSDSLNNPENQNPTVIASEQSERGNLPTTENEQNLSGSLKEPTADKGGLILPENIQNIEFCKQAASVWQSTVENPRKIENTADERSKDISSKHHTYIEALKTDLKDLIETGDFYKASERLGDIRLNQQVFDERIQKAEIQNSLPEQNPTADKGGIVSPVYGQQNQMVVANAAQKQHKSKRR